MAIKGQFQSLVFMTVMAIQTILLIFLSTYWNNKVLYECAAQGVRYIFLTNRN